MEPVWHHWRNSSIAWVTSLWDVVEEAVHRVPVMTGGPEKEKHRCLGKTPHAHPDQSCMAPHSIRTQPEAMLLTADEHVSVLKEIRMGKQQHDWLQVRGCVGAEKKELADLGGKLDVKNTAQRRSMTHPEPCRPSTALPGHSHAFGSEITAAS